MWRYKVHLLELHILGTWGWAGGHVYAGIHVLEVLMGLGFLFGFPLDFS